MEKSRTGAQPDRATRSNLSRYYGACCPSHRRSGWRARIEYPPGLRIAGLRKDFQQRKGNVTVQKMRVITVEGPVAFAEAGATAGAITVFRRAISRDPGNADTWANLGWALFQARRLEEGIEANRNAIDLDQTKRHRGWTGMSRAMTTKTKKFSLAPSIHTMPRCPSPLVLPHPAYPGSAWPAVLGRSCNPLLVGREYLGGIAPDCSPLAFLGNAVVEVIQPQVPLQLPRYDFFLVAAQYSCHPPSNTRTEATPVKRRAVCARNRDVFPARC